MNQTQSRLILLVAVPLMTFGIATQLFTLLNGPGAMAQLQPPGRAKEIPHPGAPLLAELSEQHGYRLDPDQVLRRVPPPYPALRIAYYEVGHPEQASAIKSPPDSIIFFWTGKNLKQWGMSFGSGYSVKGIAEAAFKIPGTTVEGPAVILKEALAGDWIMNPDAAEEKLLEQFEAILVKEFDLQVHVHFAKRVRPVFVASGQFRDDFVSDTPSTQSAPVFHRVNVFETTMTTGAGGGSGDHQQFLQKVGIWINSTIIDEISAAPESLKLSWQFFQGQRFKGPDQVDAGEVLAKISEQTGLQFKKELRPVRQLIIEPREPEAKPDL